MSDCDLCGLRAGDLVGFERVACGVLDGTGCKSHLYGIHAAYVGLAFRGGLLVHVCRIEDGGHTCPNCGRPAQFIYTPCKCEANETIYIDREVEAALEEQ